MSKLSRIRHQTRTEYFEYLKETARYVDVYVAQFIQDKYIRSSDLTEKLMSRYRFGKSQLRPAQVRLAYEVIEADNWKKTIPACASVEAKDTGYYCLDDVIDSGLNPALIVLGEIFSSISYSMLNGLFENFSPKQVEKVLEELADLDTENADAFLIDLNLKQPNMKLYLQKVRGYNFWEHALKIGAILGNASPKEVEMIGLAGRNIGMGYIVANDTWDFAKRLEDFRAGKYTLPIIFAFENTTQYDRKKLELLFGQDNLSTGQVDEVRRIIVRSDVIEHGKKVAQGYCDEGIKLLQNFPDTRARRMLEFATTMTQRNKFYNSLKKYQ